jgi:putative N6-adenine-specific DNA methylase
MILGGEISPHVARKAESNLASAELKDMVHIKNVAFQELDPPDGGGILILNPPYGERMDKDDDLHALYKSIGDTLKKRWAGYDAWVITSNMEAAKHIHLTPKPKIKLFNGALECRFLRFELYSGTKRADRSATSPSSAGSPPLP